MTRHILRRLVQSIPTIFGITLFSYLLLHFAPGDPVSMMLFGQPNISQEDRAHLAAFYGLDDPWYIQYVAWLTGNDWMWWKNKYDDETGELIERNIRYGIMRGDFGVSYYKKRPANELILERLPATMELGVSTLIVALVLGIPIGIGAAVWRGGWFDNVTRILAVLGQAIPNFWFGLILILIFGIALDIEWARGDMCDVSKYTRTPCGQVPITERYQYLILPTIVLAYGGVAGYSRFMRTAMLDTINSDYIRTARAKGLSPRSVWFKHAARNALIPIATFLGPAVVGILGGAALTEQIFNWPGLGRLYVSAVGQRDYPIIMASVLVGALLTVIAYIISDILYAVFDPRIRF